MAIVISGNGIDMGGNPVSNASQVEVQENQVSPFSGFKNYIINGNFDVWQRGTSQTTSGYDSDDRWNNVNIGSTKTHSRVACTDIERALFNANYFSRTVVSSVAGGIALKMQKIEDVTRLQGKTVTLSFWAKADSNKNIAIEFSQNFGNGGSPSSQVNTIGSQLVALTTTWQKKTITVVIPSITGKALGTDGVHTSSTQLAFYYDDGITPSRSANLGQQSGTFDIAQVQLEEGSVATPFEQRPYGLELSLCQRYYLLGSGVVQRHSNSGNYMGTQPINFNYSMRVQPTISFYKSGVKIGANALDFSASTTGLLVYGGTEYATSAIGDHTSFNFNASAEL